MSNKRKILFIINPISGTGKKKVVEKLLDSEVDKSVVDFEIKYTDFAGHAKEIAREVVKSNSHQTVVAVGGDGSVNEVANGLIGSNVSMGIIPAGSGNGFARHLGIPLKFKKAIRTIISGAIKTVDTGVLNNEKFVGVAGAGFDAFISKKFDEAPSRGFWTYFKLTLSEYLKYSERVYTINVNGEKLECNALILSFCNSCQWGNNAFIAPNADTSDGYLRLAIVRKMPVLSIPFFAYKLFNKKVNTSKYYKEIKFQTAKVTQFESLVHIDGEPIDLAQELNITVNSDSLFVIC